MTPSGGEIPLRCAGSLSLPFRLDPLSATPETEILDIEDARRPPRVELLIWTCHLERRRLLHHSDWIPCMLPRGIDSPTREYQLVESTGGGGVNVTGSPKPEWEVSFDSTFTFPPTLISPCHGPTATGNPARECTKLRRKTCGQGMLLDTAFIRSEVTNAVYQTPNGKWVIYFTKLSRKLEQGLLNQRGQHCGRNDSMATTTVLLLKISGTLR